MLRDALRRLGLTTDPRRSSWGNFGASVGGGPPGAGVEARVPPGYEQPEPEAHQPDERSGVRIVRPENPTSTAAPDRRLQEVPSREAPPLETEPEPEPEVVRTRVLGVNLAATGAYLAVVEPPDEALPHLAEELVPLDRLDGGERLMEFSRQISKRLQELNVGTVAVARPLRYSNWTYTNAFERISLETCFMLEAERRSIRFESVGQNHAANVVGLPLQTLADTLPARLHMKKMTDWANRWPALLVALAVALESGSSR